jgi:alkanesulfonate monooxygenase SsuD/methylene tetrahydromethanopterin reductase-like flavin-dependent oxidoreductase (luciferase family)
MELGRYSFGDVQRDPDTGQLGSTAQAMRNLLEAIKLADEVGLDFFGIGEHHTYQRVVNLHRSVGHMRQFLQMDIGSLPHEAFLRGIELLGTRVKPMVDAELGAQQPVASAA